MDTQEGIWDKAASFLASSDDTKCKEHGWSVSGECDVPGGNHCTTFESPPLCRAFFIEEAECLSFVGKFFRDVLVLQQVITSWQ